MVVEVFVFNGDGGMIDIVRKVFDGDGGAVLVSIDFVK